MPFKLNLTSQDLSGIGIKNPNPQYDLDVSGDINFTGNLTQNGSAFIGSNWTKTGSNDENIRYSSGSVGIGMTASGSGSVLDVSGNMVLKGNMTIDGSNNLNIVGHDGSANGLKLAGTLVKASGTELNYVKGVTSDIQTQIDTLTSNTQGMITGSITTVTTNDLSANVVVVSDASGKISQSSITTTELGYLDNLSGNVQSQISDISQNKQDTITTDSLSITDVSGLTASLASKQATISTDDLAMTDVSGLTASLASKQDTITGAASTIISTDLSENRVLIVNANGKIEESSITTSELDRLNVTTLGTSEDGKVVTQNNGLVQIGGNIRVTGNMIVDGTTTTINSSEVDVSDVNIRLGVTTNPSNSTAEGGGITVEAGSDGDKTFAWSGSTEAWTSSEHIDVASGKAYKIGGTDILSSTTIANTVVNSSLTSVGTLNGLSVDSDLDIKDHDGVSNGLKLNGTLVLVTGAQMNQLNGISITKTIQAQLDEKQATISTDDLSMTDVSGLVAALAAKQDVGGTISMSDISGLSASLASKQSTISTDDLAITDVSGLTASLASKQATISTDDLAITDVSGLSASLASKQATISTDDLAITDVSGLSASLASKQSTIEANDLAITDVSGLSASLASKQATISTDDLAITDVSGLTASLASKQDNIGTDDLAITDVSGLSASLASKQATISTDDLAITDVSGLTASLASKQATISTDDLAITDVSGLTASLASKQATITTDDLAITDVSGLTASLASKQDVIGTDSIKITDVSGLTPALASKQDNIGTDDLAITDVSGLTASLASKQDNIGTDDLAITDVSGLTASLASKQDNIGTDDLAITDVSGLTSSLASKQDNITGAATTILSSDLTSSKIMVTNSDGKVATSTISSSDLDKLNVTTVGTSENGKVLTQASGLVTVDGNITIIGDLSVQGTTTTINSSEVDVSDVNIRLGATTNPSNNTAEGGGITLEAGSDGDKTISWSSVNDSWNSSEHMNVSSGKVYKVDSTEVLSKTGLGSTVTSSSLTSFGTIPTIDINGGTIDGTKIGSSTPSDASFVNVDISSGTISSATITNVVINGGTIGGVAIGSNTPSSGSFTNLTATNSATLKNVDISGGSLEHASMENMTVTSSTIATSSIDSTTIGSTTPSSGKFTTLEATTSATIASVDINAGTIDNTSIGATTPSTAVFTDLTASNSATLKNVDISGGSLEHASMENMTVTSSAIDSTTIGSTTPSTAVFTDLTANTSATIASVDINSGTIDNTAIGSVTPSTAVFTNLTANTSAIIASADINSGTIDNTAIGSVTPSTAVFTDLTANTSATLKNVDISGGSLEHASMENMTVTSSTIDSTTIGATTRSTGAFTTLAANNNVTFNGGTQTMSNVDINAGTIDNTSIGASTPSTAVFTNLTANTSATLSNVDIDNGSMDNVAIGANTHTTGKFTTLEATTSATIASVDINAGTIDNTDIGMTTPADASFVNMNVNTSATIASATITTADINGGTLDDVAIGSTIHGTGKFTTLEATTSATIASATITTADINAGTIDNASIGASTPSTAVFTDLTANTSATLSNVDIDNGSMDNVVIGANTHTTGKFTNVDVTDTATIVSVDINSGTIDNTTIGGVTAAAGSFTTLSTSTSAEIHNADLKSSLKIDGVTVNANSNEINRLTVSTLGTSEDNKVVTQNNGLVIIDGSINIVGDLIVRGTTTTINSSQVDVSDANLRLGVVDNPSNSTADTGGIIIEAGTDGDKTLQWLNSNSSWTSSENMNLVTSKSYNINNKKIVSLESNDSRITSQENLDIDINTSGGSGKVNFRSNNSIKSVITTDGHLGISKTTASEALDVNGNAAISGTATIGDNLTVNGATTTINSNSIDISGDVVIRQTTTLKGGVTFESDSTFDNNLTVDGATTTLNSNLVDISGSVDISGATAIEKTLRVGDDTTLESKLTVDDATTLNSTLDVQGVTTLENNVIVNGVTTTLNSNLVDISGSVDISGATAIEKTLRVGDDTTLESNLTVEGATTTINSSFIDIQGDVDIASTLTVWDNVTLHGDKITINSDEVDLSSNHIRLGVVDNSSNSTANNGGIVLRAGSDVDKTLLWKQTTDSWTTSEHIDFASGKGIKVEGNKILDVSTNVQLQSSKHVDIISNNASSGDYKTRFLSGSDKDVKAVIDGSGNLGLNTEDPISIVDIRLREDNESLLGLDTYDIKKSDRSEQSAKDPSGGSGHHFGTSIAMSVDYAIVGSPDDSSGSAIMFERNSSNSWTSVKKIRDSAGVANAFGHSVSVNNTYAIVGAPEDSSSGKTNMGAALFYERDETLGWVQKVKFVRTTDGSANDKFGSSVSINDNYAIVSSERASGFAVIYKRNSASNEWEEHTVLTTTLTNKVSQVAMEDGYLVLGIPEYSDSDDATKGTGALQVYNRNTVVNYDASGNVVSTTDTWSLYATLRSSVSGISSFGKSVSIFGDIIVAGSPDYNKGSVFIFEKSASGTWSLTTQINGISSGDKFGSSLSVSNHYVLVGAVNESTQGKVYMYKRSSSGTWSQHSTIVSSDIATNDQYGVSVSMSHNSLMIGANKHDEDSNSDSGAVYFYENVTDKLDIHSDDLGKVMTITDSKQLGINVENPSATLDVGGDVNIRGTMKLAQFKGSIVPDEDVRYDIGSVSKRIRHLYISKNSMWVGDAHKITVDANGDLKFRKRVTDVVPPVVENLGGTESGALNYAGKASLSDLTLDDWLNYTRSFEGQEAITIDEIFRDDPDDYSEDQRATIDGAASTITADDLVANIVVVSDASGKIAASNITINELNRLDVAVEGTSENGKVVTQNSDLVRLIAGLYVQNNVDISGSVEISGNTVIQNNLTVNGTSVSFATNTTELLGALSVTSNASFGSNVDVSGNMVVDGTALIKSAATFSDDLTVNGSTTTLNSEVDINGAMSVSSNVDVSGNMVVDGTALVKSAVTFSDDLTVNGSTTTLNSEVDINGAMSVSSNVDVSGNMVVDGTALVKSAATFSDDLTVNGSTITLNSNLIDISGSVDISGATAIEKTLRVGDATTLESTLNVSGSTTIDNNFTVSNATNAIVTSTNIGLVGDVDITGPVHSSSTVDISGAMTVEGATTLKSAATLESTLDVTSAATFSDDLTVNGSTTTLNSEVDINGAMSVSSNVDVSGNMVVDGTALVNSAATFSDDLTVNGTTTTLNSEVDINGAMSVSSNVDVSGNMIVDGTSQLKSTLAVTGATTMADNLTVNGSTTTLNSEVDINGAMSVSSNVDVSGNMVVDGTSQLKSTLAVTGATTMASTLGVTGAATFADNLTVNGSSTALNSSLSVSDAATFSDDLTVNGSTTTLNSEVDVNGAMSVSSNVDVSGNMVVDGTVQMKGSSTTIDSASVDITAHNASSTGLKLGGTLVTSSAAELNYLDITTLGVSEDNKAVTQKDSLVDVDGSMNIRGNLYVQGTTTSINSSQVDISDANIRLGVTTNPSNITANGGGITVEGGSDGDKTLSWNSSTSAWTSSEHVDVDTGKTYKIAGNEVLSSTTLGSGVTSSSLTNFGTIPNIDVDGGSIDGTTIGANSAAAGTFTNLTSTRLDTTDASMTNLDASGKVKQDGKEVLTDYVNYNSTTNTFLAVSNHAIFNVGVASSTYSVNNIGEDSDGDLPIIKAKSGTLLEFRLDVTGEPFNIYIGDVSGTSGTLPEGLFHIASNGTVTNLTSSHSGTNAMTSGTVFWKVPTLSNQNYRYQSGDNSQVYGVIQIENVSSAITEDFIPSVDNVYSLGAPDKMWRDVYIGPGSLYVNGTKVIDSSADTINVTTDEDQNLKLKTSGTGQLQIESETNGISMSTESAGNISLNATGTGDIVMTTSSGVVKFNSNVQIQNGLEISNPNGDDVFINDGLKVNDIKTDTIIEKTSGVGVTIEQVLIKDNDIAANNLVLGGSATIPGGTIDNAPIGLGVPNQARFTSVDICNNMTINNNLSVSGDASFNIITNGTLLHNTQSVVKFKITLDNGGNYVVNGVLRPVLELVQGVEYEFDQTDSTNNYHELRFYKNSAGGSSATDQLTSADFDGYVVTAGSGFNPGKINIIPGTTTPAQFNYDCSQHGSHGLAVLVKSSTNLRDLDVENDASFSSINVQSSLKLSGTAVTATASELNQLSGISSNVQTQIDDVSSNLNTITLSDISQVDISGASSGDLLMWNGSNMVKASSSGTMFTMNNHIIPDTNSSYDLGSAEYKIRHLFLSNNSLWIGDKHKITIGSDDKLKFRKRVTNIVPKAVEAAGGNLDNAKSFAGRANISEFTSYDWVKYMRTLPGQENADIENVFRDNDDDYEENLEAKATGAISDIYSNDLSANRVLISSGEGKIGVHSNVSSTELGYLDGVTSSIQTQINGVKSDVSSLNTTTSNLNTSLSTKQDVIADGDLTIAKTSGLQTALDGKQATIADGDLTIAKTSGLQTALDSKQSTIADGDLTIAKTSGLQTALDGKQASIGTDDLEITDVSGLTVSLASKQPVIGTGDLSISDISGLQTAIDNASSSVLGDVSMATLDISQNINAKGGGTFSGGYTFNQGMSLVGLTVNGSFKVNDSDRGYPSSITDAPNEYTSGYHGELRFDRDENKFYTYNGGSGDTSGWRLITPMKIVNTQPDSQTTGYKGEARFDSSTNKLYINDNGSTSWKTISSGGNGSSSDSTVNNRGQSFFEMMTQQPPMFTASGDFISTTSSITINWHYNDILASHENNILAKLAFQNLDKEKSLPYINKIYVDISGVADGAYTSSSGTWVSYTVFTVNGSYDTSTYKTLTFDKTLSGQEGQSAIKNILSKLTPIDVRIYGENHSENIPTVEDRALIIPSITFVQPKEPSAPVFVSERSSNSSSNHRLFVTYKVSQTEDGLDESTAQINSAILDYSANETIRSSLYPVSTTTITTSPQSVANKNENESFELVMNYLATGTKYNFQAKAKNTLVDDYSEFSESTLSQIYTDLPSLYSHPTNLNLNINKTEYVTNSNTLNNSNIVYINTSGGSQTVTPSSTSTQSFVITNPDPSKTQTYGYGKYVDGSTNLVNFKVYVNDELRQEIQYNGFDISNSSSTTVDNTLKNGNTFNFVKNVSQLDKYNDFANSKGIHLEGHLGLETVANNNVVAIFGDPSSNPYTIRYDYTRHSDVNSANNSNITTSVYVDDLPSNPSINSNNRNNTVTVKTVEYTMGIPSVETFDLGFERQYLNINSEYGYIRGDTKIAEINTIAGTSIGGDVRLYLDRSEIDASGVYTYNEAQFHSKTSNAFKNMYHTNSLINSSSSGTITIHEKVFSLKTTATQNFKDVYTNHYCDRSSYNGSSNNGSFSLSRKFTTTFYEITDTTELAKLGSNLGGIGVTQYSSADHSQQIKDWTLLYINGSIQTNASQAYPTLSDFTYTGVTITNTYDAGTKSYALDGTVTSDNTGYKWMVFKIAKNGSSTGYTFNNTSVPLKSSEDNYAYISIKDILSPLFGSTVTANLFDANNTNAIGFCRATTASNGDNRVGSFKKPFGPTGQNWTEHGGAQTSYNNLANKYGSYVSSGTDYGIYSNLNSLNDDLEIFIGLKNNSS